MACPIEQADHLVALLRNRAMMEPDSVAYVFLENGDSDERCLTYAQLDRRARAIASRLQACGVDQSSVLLLFPHGLEYISAFMGCLYAGAIAVPAYPPARHHLHRLETIVRDSQSKCILSDTTMRKKVSAWESKTGQFAELEWICTDRIEDGEAGLWKMPTIAEDALAFLQYTSGSTGSAKGVMVSHGNLMANQRAIQEAFGHDRQSTVVGWLPLYHDMGLIGNVLQPLFIGASAILMPPMAFLEKPLRWLSAISRYRASTSGGPDFAFDLCVKKISAEQKAGLDLSSWTVAFNGSEPVRAETLDRFTEAFRCCGFRREAFYPCYGLAEATLFVTGSAKLAPPAVRAFERSALAEDRAIPAQDDSPDGRRMVASGRWPVDHRLLIVDPVTRTGCEQGRVGEIWLSGPSVAHGYWNKPTETKALFQAGLADGTGGLFLRTGDFGFIDRGELFVSGRLKDLIIIRGRNYYPQDIESAVNSIKGIRAGSCAAFSVDCEGEGEERVVVAFEAERAFLKDAKPKTLISEALAAVASQCEIQAATVVVVKPGAMPKTSSGKIRRQACRQSYLDGGLPVLARGDSLAGLTNEAEPPAQVSETEHLREAMRCLAPDSRIPLVSRYLVESLARTLRVDESSLSSDRSLSALGLDSLQAVDLKHRVDLLLGADIPISRFLSEQTIAELAEFLATQTAGSDRPAISPKQSTENDGPQLSYPQLAIWTVHQIEPHSIAYNLHVAFRLSGPLVADRLRQAFLPLMERHPVLRTTYRSNGEKTWTNEVPLADVSDPVSVVDASQWTPDRLQEDITRRGSQARDLATGPIFQAVIYCNGPNRHTILLCGHHIAVDLWSLLILLREWRAGYEALANGTFVETPPLRSDYRQFLIWQRCYLQSARAEQDWLYWQDRLSGPLPMLALPADRPRPTVPNYRGRSEAIRLGREATAWLKALGLSQGATLFMTLLAAYKVLLYRYTGQQDLIVGAPGSGRAVADFAPVVGNFVNPIAVRTRPSAALSFSSYLRQVRDTVLGALEHQDFPFGLIIDRLQPERTADQWPVYQTWFVLQRSQSGTERALALLALGEESDSWVWGNWTMEPVPIRNRVENFDLKLMAAECEDGLLLSFQYRGDLYSSGTIRRMARHFEVLLAAIVETPDRRLSALSLLDQGERRLLLQRWNDTSTEYPETGQIPRLIERQAARRPAATALVFGEESLSYAELNARANRLARGLVQRGIGRDDVVAICALRSVELVIGLLGILKAGAAFLPLDPDYPRERLLVLLQDSGAQAVLVQTGLENFVPASPGQRLPLDRAMSAFMDQGASDLSIPIEAEQLAYVLFTSGSTGRPKGVGVPHRGLRNRLLWMQDYFGLDGLDAVLQKTPYSFDVSIWEFFWPLMVGARLVVAEPDAHRDPAHLVNLIEVHGVTTLHFVPSMLRAFLEAADSERCTSLKRVICSGEALTSELAALSSARLKARLYNLYGPTEASIDVTAWNCPATAEGTSVPIGRPIANTQIFLLDQHLNPVPVGVAGELYIAGVGLARGYLGRTDLTAASFLPNPFGEQAGARMYRSGDLARYRPDGVIEYLGRIDHQVKIRGLRIELGEIEAQLLSHPRVREAVVVVREELPGSKRLVAYVAGALAEEELRAHLQTRLPEYMLPAVFVVLESLPLSANGKVDRKALPMPDFGAQAAQRYVAPRNDVEANLARIWGELLHVERLGVHDNFFELGGDSILSIQMASRASQIGIRLAPRQVFQHQSVATLAEVACLAPEVQMDQGLVFGEAPLT
ncbi:MAG: amino acid adenylation domain-containing protein, partial [Methylococcales bacterium]